MIDLRFATALQMVLSVALADRNGLRCSSRILAESLATNPSFIRKLLVPLSRAGMIVTTIGKGGGLHLGRFSGEITLREIYQTVTAEKIFLSIRQYISCICPIIRSMKKLFSGILENIEGAIYSILEKRPWVTACIGYFSLIERRIVEL